MNLKSSIAIGLVGGVVVFTALIWKWTDSKELALRQLENREIEADHLLQADGTENEIKTWEKKYLDLVTDSTRLRGPEAFPTLHCRELLVHYYRRANRNAEAEAEYRDIVRVMDHTLGKDDARTREARNEFMVILADNHKLTEAEKEARALLQFSEQSKGRLAKETLGPRESVIQILELQDKFEERLSLLKTDLEIIAPLAAEQRARLGKEPLPMPADMRGRIPIDYRSEETIAHQRITTAEKELAVKKQWEEAKAKLGQNHPDAKALEQQLQDLKDESL